VGVACSGGRDSLALLHAVAAGAASLGLRVFALHVNHGLQAPADAWQAHVARTCRRWSRQGRPVTFVSRRLDASPPPGASIEAWAREARYAALVAMARANGCPLVLLAHHRGDQAETVLLQALRGSGPAGLAAMGTARDVDGVLFARPWLDHSRSSIEAYARRHRLGWVDDNSNCDPRFDRNRLRREVLPVLEGAFPGAEAALARAARAQAQAADVLAEVAALDLAACRDGDTLGVPAWKALSPGRRAGALRAWLADIGVGRDAALVDRLLEELPAARSGARWPLRADSPPASSTGGLWLYRGRLMWRREGPAATTSRRAPFQPCELRLGEPGLHRVPGLTGQLRVVPATAGGIPWSLLAAVRIVPRRGGEQFQAGEGRPPRALKKQYQAAGVPPWARDAPLVLAADGRLLYAPGLGIDARCRAPDGAPQAVLDWVP
jgi:tRNA(Ile)-lysidine synthase